jgi:hypothetical protein
MTDVLGVTPPNNCFHVREDVAPLKLCIEPNRYA